jgi:hypothetical protein
VVAVYEQQCKKKCLATVKGTKDALATLKKQSKFDLAVAKCKSNIETHGKRGGMRGKNS